MMRISQNFTLAELTKSNTATRLGISNTPDKEGIHKLRLLATELLQPLRNAVGALRVTSGYRSESLNKAIGGSNKSQHTKCEAVDLQFVKRKRYSFNCFIFFLFFQSFFPQNKIHKLPLKGWYKLEHILGS